VSTYLTDILQVSEVYANKLLKALKSFICNMSSVVYLLHILDACGRRGPPAAAVMSTNVSNWLSVWLNYFQMWR